MKSTNLFQGLAALFLLFFAVAAILFALEDNHSTLTGDAPLYGEEQLDPNTDFYKVKYIYKTTNVRKGPGTNYPIVTQLKRGDSIRVIREEKGWSEVYIEGYTETYIYSQLLHDTPLPDVEISSWNWYKDPDFGSNGAVIWNVRVNNNTNEYIEYVLVEFSTYDANDELITSNQAFVTGLSPGGYGVAKSYATYFGPEEHARIRIVEYK